MIIIPHRITKEFLKLHLTDMVFVYAVTVRASIAQGQGSVAHYYPNCYGVPTKFRNCKTDSVAFFHDSKFDLMIKYEIDRAINDIPRKEGIPIILFPKIGCGAADLPNRAPKCYEYLMQELKKIATPYKIDYTFR